jgi:hypothetical protein
MDSTGGHLGIRVSNARLPGIASVLNKNLELYGAPAEAIDLIQGQQ